MRSKAQNMSEHDLAELLWGEDHALVCKCERGHDNCSNIENGVCFREAADEYDARTNPGHIFKNWDDPEESGNDPDPDGKRAYLFDHPTKD